MNIQFHRRLGFRVLCALALLLMLIPLTLVSCQEATPSIGTDTKTAVGTGEGIAPEDTAERTTEETSGSPQDDTDDITSSSDPVDMSSDTAEGAASRETTDDGVLTLPAEPVYPEPDTGAAEMPRLDIITEGGQAVTSTSTYVRTTVTLSRCDETYQFSDVGAQIRVRGNSTAAAPKKPYRLKFDVKQEMLGLSGGKAFRNWCLMADYYDGSMLRTFGTFKLAKVLLENKYFSADCTHTEVYLNGEYQGVYLLCDQTQIHKNRINIPEKEDGDTAVEIGYLMIGQGGRSDEPESIVIRPEITVRDRNGDTMYFGAMNFALSGSGYTDEQKAYVSDYVSGVFKVVAHAVYDQRYYSLTREGRLIPKRTFEWAKTEEEKQIETVSAVFNIESAVAMCILDEIVKNLDAMTFNMYVDLSPEGDGVLTLAAPWDFDFAMANTHYASTHSYTGFYATNLSYSEGMRTNLWYVMLGSIDWFEEMIREKWQEHYPALKAVVAETRATNIRYDAAFNRDFDRWGKPVSRNLIHHHCTADLKTFDDHMAAGTFVTDWLTLRLWWLNRQWGDGTHDEPLAEPAEDLELVFEDEADLALIDGIKRCTVKLTDRGLRLAPDAEARDPYFSFHYDLLDTEYDAAFYPYLEFTYKIPATCSADTYYTELFLCTGQITEATGGISTGVEVIADGRWHTVKLDLSASGYWAGTIHKIRFDFFSDCKAGDSMFLKEFKLLPS